MKAQNFHVKEFQGKEGLSKIREEWNAITNTLINKRFYHIYQWYESYIDTLESNDADVYFFLLYKGDKPLAIFPLKKIRKKILGIMFKALEIPNHPNIDLSDFIFGNTETKARLLDSLITYLNKTSHTQWAFICMPHALEESTVFQFIKNFPYKSLSVHEIIGKCDYIASHSNKEIYGNLSANFRASLRKAKNKLVKEVKVEFVLARQKKELLTCFEEFLDVESSGWKGEQGTKTAIKFYPERKKFYQHLIDTFAEFNGCEINLLRINDRCIAGQFCLIVDNTIYILKIGYDEKYSKMAPGNMLLENLIQRVAIEGSIKYINLTTGAKWHDNWTQLFYKVYKVIIFNKNLSGMAGLILIRGEQILRLLYHKYYGIRQRTKFIYNEKGE